MPLVTTARSQRTHSNQRIIRQKHIDMRPCESEALLLPGKLTLTGNEPSFIGSFEVRFIFIKLKTENKLIRNVSIRVLLLLTKLI